MKADMARKWTVALLWLSAGVVGSLFGLWVVPVEKVEAAGNIWTVTSPGDDVTDGNLALHTGSLRFALAHAVSGDVIGFDIQAVDKLYPATTLVVPPGVAVGHRRDQPCGSYKTPLINMNGQSLSTGTVVSLTAGSTLRNVDISWGRVSLRVAGADVDVCGVGLGLEADGEGNVTPLPASGIALAVDGDHAVIHQNYINGQVVVTDRGSDSRIGDAVGGSGDTNDGIRDASVIVSTSATGAAQRVTIRDPFPRLLQNMVGAGVSGGDDVSTHANNWAQTPVILSAYTPDNFTTVQVQGTANPLSVVDLYFDNQVTIARQPSLMADASGHFSFTGALPGPNVLIMAASTLNASAHSNRLGSSSQLSGVAHVTTEQPPTLLQLAPSTLSFTTAISLPLPSAQVLHVSAPNLTWQAAITPMTATNWLSITPSSGNGDGVISVTVKAHTLPPGVHQATITVHELAKPGNQATTTVTLTALAHAPIQLAPPSLKFTEVLSQPLPAVQRLNVSAPGVTWQVAITPTTSADWLVVLPMSSSGNRLLIVELKPNLLPPGVYRTNLKVQDRADLNNQMAVPVTLVVQTQATGQMTATAYLPLLWR